MKNFLWSKSWDSLINRVELGLRNWSPWGNGFTTEGNKWLRAPSAGTDLFLNTFIESSDCLRPGAVAQPTGLKISSYAIPIAHVGVISHRLLADICEALHFFMVILMTLVHTFLVEKAPELKDRFIFCSYELSCALKCDQRMGPFNNWANLLNN